VVTKRRNVKLSSVELKLAKYYPSAESINEEETIMQAYCVKDKKKVEIKNPKAIIMKNGRPATQGVCPICGNKVFRIGKS
jgi:hypothetical protein